MKMSKEKNAVELAEMLSTMLDVLVQDEVTPEQLKIADSIANQVGKATKLAALRIAYKDYRDKGGEVIKTLESK